MKQIGSLIALGRIHRSKCRTILADGTTCDTWTRMAVVVPVSDLDDDGAGLAGVACCGEHLEPAFIRLNDGSRKDGTTLFPFVSWADVDQAIIDGLMRLAVKDGS